MTRTETKNRVNQILRISTTNLFNGNDNWAGIYKIMRNVWLAQFDLEVTDSYYCDYDQNNDPHTRAWKIQINTQKQPIYGIIYAHAAGSISEPFSKYGVSAYVS